MKLSLWASLIFAFLFSGCVQKDGIEEMLVRYERRTEVRSSQGTLYRVEDFHLFASDDDGMTWIELSIIPSEGYSAWGYSLACSKNDILYFAQVGMGKGKKAVYFSDSSDGGKSWSQPTTVNDDIVAQRRNPKIFGKGEEIFVVWTEESVREGRHSGIYFSHSSNGGRDWNEDLWIRQGEDPWIEFGEDETLYLTYVGGERGNIIYLSYSKDRGKSWRTETTGELSMMIEEPYANFMGKTVTIICQAWNPNLPELMQGPGAKLTYHTYSLKSDDEGKSWSEMKEIKQGR